MKLSAGIHWFLPTLPVYVMDAQEDGPTAVIEAGIHGDEVAGVHAVEELLEAGLSPARGRLIVIPRMNPAACRARIRACPPSLSPEGRGWAGLDLNRCFPGDASAPELEKNLAHRFMQLMKDERPDLVCTLHESQKRYSPEVKPSFGQTLVYGVDPCPPMIDRVVAGMNASKLEENEAWATQYYPVATSSTEVIVDAIGCIGVCVETWMGFPEARRIAMQREVVRLFLDEIGILPLSQPLSSPVVRLS